MVGPSSSHTAGAVKIGYISRKLLGEQPVSARILLYGSFLTTGKGHGTRKALVAGLSRLILIVYDKCWIITGEIRLDSINLCNIDPSATK